MAELRTKVMAGRFKPITPGKYSADLINLMGQLLQVNPQRRPEVSKILASSVVQKHAAGGSHRAAPAEPSSKGNVLQTIKVPQQRAYVHYCMLPHVCCELRCLALLLLYHSVHHTTSCLMLHHMQHFDGYEHMAMSILLPSKAVHVVVDSGRLALVASSAAAGRVW